MQRSPGQPRGARGTVGHAYSALNLRLLLALFGMLACGVLAVILFAADRPGYAWLLIALALIGAVDAAVVQRRRVQRRRAERGAHHSLFE
ncbi:MAG: DUF6343 family protein [Dehalococcoidia bacterium]